MSAELAEHRFDRTAAEIFFDTFIDGLPADSESLMDAFDCSVDVCFRVTVTHNKAGRKDAAFDGFLQEQCPEFLGRPSFPVTRTIHKAAWSSEE